MTTWLRHRPSWKCSADPWRAIRRRANPKAQTCSIVCNILDRYANILIFININILETWLCAARPARHSARYFEMSGPIKQNVRPALAEVTRTVEATRLT